MMNVNFTLKLLAQVKISVEMQEHLITGQIYKIKSWPILDAE